MVPRNSLSSRWFGRMLRVWIKWLNFCESGNTCWYHCNRICYIRNRVKIMIEGHVLISTFELIKKKNRYGRAMTKYLHIFKWGTSDKVLRRIKAEIEHYWCRKKLNYSSFWNIFFYTYMCSDSGLIGWCRPVMEEPKYAFSLLHFVFKHFGCCFGSSILVLRFRFSFP